MRACLSTHGLQPVWFFLSEAELRQACDTTDLGTSALHAVDAARHYGFTQTTKQTLNGAELAALVAAAHYPIVFINLWPIEQIRETHALVVIAITAADVVALDPAQGERLLPRLLFDTAWARRDHLAILVAR